ncbi:MAG: outer membrane protein transport protein [Myxococcales bacterium]
MRSKLFLALALLFCAVTNLLPQRAQASGFFLTERGVRTLGRGGAFVAGAEGAESLWINPAGLKGAGASFRMEGNLAFLRASFARVDDGGNQYKPVDLSVAKLPIPLFGITNNFGLEDWDFGLAVYVQQFALYTWPDHVGSAPAPNRYSLYSLKGSIFANTALGAAWHPIEGLSLGVSAALVAGRFKASTALSACDGFVCVHPEDPSFDVATTITLPIFATVMIGAGITYEAGPVKIGASLQTPWNIKGEAEIKAHLPTNAVFDNARIDGNKADVNVPFPWIGRAGVEINPNENLSLEVAGVYEGWSRQDYITADTKGMYLRNIVGIGDYEVGSIKIPRLMSNSYSIRGGFEYFLEDMEITIRGGLSYDTTALKDNALSPLTLDANKVVLGMGVTLHVGSVMDLDLVYGHVFMPNRTITNSDITQPAAIRPPQERDKADHIGNGVYTMEADFAGIGSTMHF